LFRLHCDCAAGYSTSHQKLVNIIGLDGVTS
jgi:hypothetical protein